MSKLLWFKSNMEIAKATKKRIKKEILLNFVKKTINFLKTAYLKLSGK